MTRKDYKLGYEIDCLKKAIETSKSTLKTTAYKIRLDSCYKQAIKQFGSIENCLNECLNS